MSEYQCSIHVENKTKSHLFNRLTLRWTLKSLGNLNVIYHTRLDTVASSLHLQPARLNTMIVIDR